jgi:starch-binding outer membrane protein, SusD/RagB family
MKIRSIRKLALLLVAASATACSDDYLVTEPQTILTDEAVWGSPAMVLGVIANYYNRLPQYHGLQQGQYEDMTAFDDAMWSSGTGWENRNQYVNYAYGLWALWNGTGTGSSYGLIRDINLAIENITATSSATMTPTLKERFVAELRFQRAYIYFEHVKRMGGVPIITEQLVYDFSGDPTYLQRPRNTEAEVYDFIASEMDAIAPTLGNAGSKTRANRFTALALKSRAMLYAGSIARHNSEMANPITLPGGIVGIPANRATEYYQKSLEASRAIIQSGAYTLYRGDPNRGENFYKALVSKSGNNEVIWGKDYAVSTGRMHLFTLQTIPRSQSLESPNGFGGSAISPSLSLVESFEYLDGSPGTLRGVCSPTGTAACPPAQQANWIFYDRPEDIFANKDGRLYGTVIYPGTSFAGKPITLQAGVYVWNQAANRYDRVEGSRFSTYSDGGVLVGADGPLRNDTYTSATGFLLRKFVDTAPAAPTSAIGSDVWWPYFRLGEIYLNAAEAALELNLQSEAVQHVNTVRARAGFPANSLSSVDRARIRNERRVELAFEDHRLWDLIRWRTAHEVWNGVTGDPGAHVHVLFGYRIVRPGHANHGKFVYDKAPSTRMTAPRFFRIGNYYSQIPESVIANNPQIVRNPFH